MGMFSGLGEKLNHIFSKLTKRGKLTELEIKQAMREVRVALLEATSSFAFVLPIKAINSSLTILITC